MTIMIPGIDDTSCVLDDTSSTYRPRGDPMTTTATPQSTLTDLTGTYTLDPAHTRIGFVARHAMVTKVRGAFNEFEGTATIDGTDPSKSSVSIAVQTASVDTRNEQRDGHLRTN